MNQAYRCVFAVLTLAGFAPAMVDAQTGGSGVTVVDPTAESILIGPVTLRIDLSAQGGDPADVQFFVDGALVCTVARVPYECAFDAGQRTIARTVRVVVNFPDGHRVVETVRTKSLDISETTGVDLVLVPVVVTDWQGHFAQKLKPEAFKVYENGALQQISSLQTENVPVDVIVAVDISGSMADSMPKLKTAVKQFLNRLRPIDHVGVIAFNDRTYAVVNRDTPPESRAGAIDALKAFGGTSLYDAILVALDRLGRDVSRKAIIVFTDGDDRNSLAPIDPVERRLRESEATVYIVTQGNGKEVDAVRRVVNRLSQFSGGRAFSTEKIDELEKALGFIFDDLTHQYLIGYSPTVPPHDGTYRRIKVTTNEKSQTVRAREGYRAPDK